MVATARDKVMLGQDPNGESLHPDNVTRVTNFDNGGGMFGWVIKIYTYLQI